MQLVITNSVYSVNNVFKGTCNFYVSADFLDDLYSYHET